MIDYLDDENYMEGYNVGYEYGFSQGYSQALKHAKYVVENTMDRYNEGVQEEKDHQWKLLHHGSNEGKEASMARHPSNYNSCSICGRSCA